MPKKSKPKNRYLPNPDYVTAEYRASGFEVGKSGILEAYEIRGDQKTVWHADGRVTESIIPTQMIPCFDGKTKFCFYDRKGNIQTARTVGKDRHAP